MEQKAEPKICVCVTQSLALFPLVQLILHQEVSTLASCSDLCWLWTQALSIQRALGLSKGGQEGPPGSLDKAHQLQGPRIS